MTTPLKDLGYVPWETIKDSSGSAEAIPILLHSLAWGDEPTAQAAFGDLRERICQYGFVVDQATAATVPFLWELARLPQVTCRVQIVHLLKNIADARQWESTATTYPKLLNYHHDYVGWERQARRAVHADQGVLRQLLSEPDVELVEAATELASTLAA
ncbi:hypothetical protein [Streptomyces chiangmaiensis]|uniref:Mutator family transposase n=1 Tax=Streptomyces chiangmaiensis TaxID=766497 RepID=A0ABU7FV43_9ACTN|nr:hypothetical protein [Streptomyces chiangmaiensis]MED7827794.1 hypothetical protein [Streptomyces chiangmaiensis]